MLYHSKFKIGDKVKLVGCKEWCDSASEDIGLVGEVVEITEDYTRISLSNSKSGNKFWSMIDNKGIELLEGQMLFSFMYDRE